MIPGRNTSLQTKKKRVLEPHSNFLSVQQMGCIKNKTTILRVKTKGETKLQMEAEYSYYLTHKKKSQVQEHSNTDSQNSHIFSSLEEDSSAYCHNACPKQNTTRAEGFIVILKPLPILCSFYFYYLIPTVTDFISSY